MKRSSKAKPLAFPTVASLIIACLVVLMVAPSFSSASSINLNISNLGISLNGITIPALPTMTPATPTVQTAETTAAGSADGYGGYANGYNGAASLPENLGTADLGLSTGGVNSDGGIVPDWPGTTQDESKAKAAGVVEAAGLRILNIPLSFGSAGSSAPPESGLLGGVTDLTLPGIGKVNIGYYQTQSGAASTQNQMKVLLLSIDALDLNMQVPLGQSSAITSRTNGKVQSTSTSTLVGAGPKQPLGIGHGLLSDGDALGLQVLDAGSTSSADGSTASSSSYWTLANLAVADEPALVIDSNDGVTLGRTTLIPAPTGGKPLLVIDQFAGLTVLTIGETWMQTDGKSYAYGGANAVRLSLLDQPSFLVLGHAGSGANAVSATGPGAGPDQINEGPPGSNIPPDAVSPPNDQPITPGDRENPIGPGPDTKPDPDPNPQPIVPGAPPAMAGPPSDVPGGDTPLSLNRLLPDTGADLLVYLMVASALAILASYAFKPMTRRWNRD